MPAEAWSPAALPVETVDAVRAAIGPLTDEILSAVRGENPVYADVLGSPEGMGIRLGIEQAIKAFLDALERGRRPPEETGEVWRRLGEAEFQAGRSLEALRAAFRTGTRAAWHGAASLAAAAGVSTAEVVALAEGIFVYTDELASHVVEGYLQMQSDEAGERERRRRRLATLLLDAEHHDDEAIERAAHLARWPVPRTLAIVAVAGDLLPGRLDVDALVGADPQGAWIIIPDPEGPRRLAAVRHALDGVMAAIGPMVSPQDAARSLRWARMALRLIERGALPSGEPAVAHRHLVDLILLQDVEMAGALAAQCLEPLEQLPPADRDRLLDTLAAWLAHQRHTPRVAAQLHVHPQTVRYRMTQLRALLGDRLETADGRLELQLALRARGSLAE